VKTITYSLNTKSLVKKFNRIPQGFTVWAFLQPSHKQLYNGRYGAKSLACHKRLFQAAFYHDFLGEENIQSGRYYFPITQLCTYSHPFQNNLIINSQLSNAHVKRLLISSCSAATS
jgi:hypothetical protein